MNRSSKLALTLMAVVGSTIIYSAPAAAQCRDPWITQAIREVTGRAPRGSGETGECTYTQYGGGRWNSYAELKGYVQSRLGGGWGLAPGQGADLRIPPNQVRIPASHATQIRTFSGRQQFQYQGRWYNLIGTDGASLIGTDGAS